MGRKEGPEPTPALIRAIATALQANAGTAVERAIRHAAAAGKLRAFVRKNGGDFRGLARLADYQSELSRGALAEICDQAGDDPERRR